MKKSVLLILNSAFIILNCHGQGYFNQWYFGAGAGLDFNSGSPVAVSGSLYSMEGCASICDYSGNLLFYTNGVTVWNAIHAEMTNGTGLLGHQSSTQSALIIPDPGNVNKYYIVTAPYYTDTLTRYSIVDMTLEGGLGAVTSAKNIVLHSHRSTERNTAVRLANGTGYWIIGHETGNNVFFSYKLTAAGFVPTPVLSMVTNMQFEETDAGYLKPSHQGNKLALASRQFNLFQIFDFDNTSGIIANPITFYPNASPYGIEFSPDDSKLYVSGGSVPPYIYQLNMNAGSPSDIINSAISIPVPVNYYGAALEMGPDLKIYVAKFNTSYLSVINNPNELGTLCNYVEDQISLFPDTCWIGLPNFFEMNTCAAPAFSLGNDTTLCHGTLTLDATTPNVTYLWQDNSTSPTFTVTQGGTYSVTITNTEGCASIDSIIVNIGVDLIITQNGDTLATTIAPNYQWYHNDTLIPGATSQNYIITESGYYYVITSSDSCTFTSNIIETACICVGINENEFARKFNAYPNPTTGQLTLESSIPGTTSYSLISIEGRLITQGSFTIHSALNIGNLSAGAYYLEMADETGNIHYRKLVAKE